MANRSLLYSICLVSAIGLLAACGGSNNNDGGGTDTGGGTDAVGHMDATTGVDATGTDGGGTDAMPTDAVAGGPRSLIILHTNDEHSHELGFGPEIDDYPTASPPGRGIVGGALRRAEVIATLTKNATVPVALVSAGDLMMGSLFHLGDVLGGLDYNIATALSYDVLTLGNHELDFGPATLAGAISKGGFDIGTMMATTLDIPIVASNIRFSMTSSADDSLAALYSANHTVGKPISRTYVKTYTQSGANGYNVKVGYIGLMGLDAALSVPFKSPVHFSLKQGTTACTHDSQCPGTPCLPNADNGAATSGFCATTADESSLTNFTQLVADAAGAVAALRQQGVDLVVALSHVGVNGREISTIQMTGQIPANPVSEEILLALGVDQALGAMNIPGIDVIVGGHSHTEIDHPLVIPNPVIAGAHTVLTQAGSYGRFVGKIRLKQASTTAPWTLDTGYSGLATVDDHVAVVPSDIGQITEAIITGAIQALIVGVETQPISLPNDGLIYPGEQCDADAMGHPALPNMGMCMGLIPNATGGTVSCDMSNRQLDLSMCTLQGNSCGNGTVQPGEMCDGTALNGQTCQSLGYLGGTLNCNTNCTYNFHGCMPFFPSLLEAVLNFQNTGAPILHGATGTLFFHQIGRTAFDVPTPASTHESNLMNLVTDAERYALNHIDPAAMQDPVRLTVNANGVLRDAIQKGQTSVISLEDMFRVLPLGVSPVEKTPGYPVDHFYLLAPEIKAALEVAVNQGLASDSFWLGVSGARVQYDLSRPAFDPANPLDPTKGRITQIRLVTSTAAANVQDETSLEKTPLFDVSLTGGPVPGYPNPMRLVHIGTSLYITLYAEALGVCPRTNMGAQLPVCQSCMMDNQCTALAPHCDMAAKRCTGGPPAAFLARAQAAVNQFGLYQELKEALALMYYIRSGNETIDLPTLYNGPIPRRMCCVGSMCGTDRSCP
jgi:2',3'-cyclic-nucleotide 2'-phosphodiesterase (5'-nucleotidase family)